MAVTVDATASSAATSASATTLTNSNLTVGVGATALLAWLCFDEIVTRPTAVTVNWDNAGSPQAMTLLADSESANTNVRTQLYGLVNPTSGNKSLTASWTSAVPALLMCQSYKGTLSSAVATTFLHAATNSGLSGSPTVTVVSSPGNISVAAEGSTAAITSLTATGSTSVFNFVDNNSFGFAGARAPGSASVIWTGAPTSTEWATAGIDISAPIVSPIRGTTIQQQPQPWHPAPQVYFYPPYHNCSDPWSSDWSQDFGPNCIGSSSITDFAVTAQQQPWHPSSWVKSGREPLIGIQVAPVVRRATTIQEWPPHPPPQVGPSFQPPQFGISPVRIAVICV